MKKMRKLIPAFAMLMVAAIMMTTASFAWFSMGTSATVTGMTVSAQANSSLVISNTKTNGTVSFVARETEIDFTAQTTTGLIPATMKDSKLQTITNADVAVDVNTGVLDDSKATWADATTANYVDFEMYIASAGTATQEGTLKVTFTGLDGITNILHQAMSVQVLYKANSAAATFTEITDDIVNVATTTNRDIQISDIVIPAAFTQDTNGQYTEVTNDYATVVLRVYFDGELTGTDGKTYVRNATMDTAGITFGVRYDFTPNA